MSAAPEKGPYLTHTSLATVLGITVSFQDLERVANVINEYYRRGYDEGRAEFAESMRPTLDALLVTSQEHQRLATIKERARIAEYLSRNLMSAREYADAILAGQPIEDGP